MRKISIKNLFKKSESDTGKNNKTKTLILLLILVVAAGAFYWWGYPFLFPESVMKSPVALVTVTTPVTTTVMPKAEVESVVKEKTEFEIEMEEREKGYINKVFVYEPYKPPSNRNPFQMVRADIPVEEKKEVKVLNFPKPELPPGTKITGIIDSKDKKVAIIEMNGETYIANLYDIISEKYIIKEIKKNEVIIDFNGTLFSLKMGGESLLDGF